MIDDLVFATSPDIIQCLPIINDASFIPDVHRELTAAYEWKIPQLKSVVKFAWALTLRTLPQYYNQGMRRGAMRIIYSIVLHYICVEFPSVAPCFESTSRSPPTVGLVSLLMCGVDWQAPVISMSWTRA